jgi:hypothetical protein
MLIGIAGAIGAGKSAIAEHLAARGFAVVAFADALREEVLARLPLTLRALHGETCPRYQMESFERDSSLVPLPCNGPARDAMACVRDMVYVRKPPIVRALLQEYGSDVRRADDPDYWVKRWAQSVSSIAAGRPVGECHVVSPDCRFPNEARTVREMGGLLWKVERPGVDGSGHVSETALAHWFDYDAVLVNDGTLADLHTQVDRLLHARLDAQADGAA